MHLAHFPGPAGGLVVAQLRHNRHPHGIHGFDFFVQPGAQDAMEERIQPGAIPQTGHIGLSQSQRALPAHGVIQAGIMNLHVPRAFTIQLHVGVRQQVLDKGFCLSDHNASS